MPERRQMEKAWTFLSVAEARLGYSTSFPEPQTLAS